MIPGSPAKTATPVKGRDSLPMTTHGTAVTVDPDTGFEDLIIINASYGRDLEVQKGQVCPDEYRLFKPFIGQADKDPLIARTPGHKAIQEPSTNDRGDSLVQKGADQEVQNRFALSPGDIRALVKTILQEVEIDEPLEIEWLREAGAGHFQILKTSPISHNLPQPLDPLVLYELQDDHPHLITRGVGVGFQITGGTVVHATSPNDPVSLSKNDILVTRAIDQSWRPLLEQVGGVITDLGGRCCEGANLARELNIPAILGTRHATKHLHNQQDITLDCSHAEHGSVYRHRIPFSRNLLHQNGLPTTRARRLLSIDSPDAAQRYWQLPDQGFGIAKIEAIIREIGVHPRALLNYDEIPDAALKLKIDNLTKAYKSRKDYFIDRLARGIAHIAAYAWPQTCVIRLNDFTSEDYRGLLDRGQFEPLEHNPKLGCRGASRYLSKDYRPCFDLECEALHRAKNKMGFHNIEIAVPFCRTVKGAAEVCAILSDHGLKRGENNLRYHLIAEVPSNIILCHKFMHLFDHLNIDLDTLTQMVLAIDPDDPAGSNAFDHLSPAVLAALNLLVEEAHRAGAHVTIFGLLEDHRGELMDQLINAGVDAFAFEPPNFIRGTLQIAQDEERYHFDQPINPNKP